MRIKLTILLVVGLLACPPFLIPRPVLSKNVSYGPARITLLNISETDEDNFEKVAASFSKLRHHTPRTNDWDIRLGGLNHNGDRDWLMVPASRQNRSRIRDLGPLDWSDDIAVPVLYILPCRTSEICGRIHIPPASSGKRIQDEDLNPHIAKPTVGHMYLVHTYRNVHPSFYSDWKGLLDFYSLVRVEELIPNKSCTITWKTIPSPEKKKK